MNALACVLTGLLALGLGVLIGRRSARRSAATPAIPAVPSAPVEPPVEPPVADLLERAFRSTEAGLAVFDRSDGVVLHNRRAEELGVVRAGEPDARAVMASQQVLRSGAPTSVDLSPLSSRIRPPRSVLARVRPLGVGYTLVEAGDTSAAVRLEATRRDFVANVSHELKTPVGAIRVLAEAVLDAVDDPVEARRFGAKILNESTRLGNLVTELIALSRLTGAERLPELAVVEVDEVVAEAMARTGLSEDPANAQVIVDAPSGMQVDGDHTLLVTALSNLLSNAIAYSPEQASVSVSRRRAAGWAEIAVTDRGIGIAREHQERVFERFFRVDPARSRATGGTGLGLAIVKHVLNNHGGEVRLWSSPGTGSTFTMRLPLRPAEDPAVVEPFDRVEAGTIPAPTFGAPRNGIDLGRVG